jgi:hypothetical protein
MGERHRVVLEQGVFVGLAHGTVWVTPWAVSIANPLRARIDSATAGARSERRRVYVPGWVQCHVRHGTLACLQ